MVDFMVKDTLLKDDLVYFGFNTPSDCSHDGLIWPLNPLVNVNDMVDMRYVDGENVDYCQMAVYYICWDFLSFWFSLIILDFRIFLVFIGFV